MSRGARISNSAIIATGVGTTVVPTFDTVIRDDAGFYNAGTPDRLTTLKTGWHLIGVTTAFSATVGTGYTAVSLNGGNILGLESMNGAQYGSVATLWYATAGDFFTNKVFTSASVNITVNAQFSPHFWILEL